MLRRLIDKLSSAVFARAVRPSGLDALSGWSKANYGSNGAPSGSIDICARIDLPVETGTHNFGDG